MTEYRDVFNRLYKKLEELKPDLIYIGGDIVHGKLDTSPEEIRLVSDFFLSLADIGDLLIIPGNHDCNLNNASREDVLSPIIDLVQQINPRIHFWKKTGVYEIGGCTFGHLSVFDMTKEGKPNAKNIPRAKDIDGEHKIAIYHGGVGNFQVDTGLVMSDKHVNVIDFDGYDMTLLGDIHKRQFLNDSKTMAYPGSLIQQNFAEAPEHGFLFWDVEKRKSEFIQVNNDYGFKTIVVDKGVVQSRMSFVPKYGNIKIKHKDTTAEQLRLVELNLRREYGDIKQITNEKIKTIDSQLNESKTKISVDDIHDIKIQNKLIEKVSKQINPGIAETTITRLQEINDLTNSSIVMQQGLARNIEWRVKYIEFDNMFSYGMDNKIDFSKLNGVVGIIAPNHAGKSALIDILAYTIFDRCSRTYKAIEVLNKKSKRFMVKLALEVNGVTYYIHREGELKIRTKKATGIVKKTCPVSVKFYMEENDELVDLSGAARNNSQYGSGTNEEIRNILGSFDDFILTSLSLQNNGQNFIDKKQAERKQILSQFMDIDLFDKLYDIAKQDVADERAVYKKMKAKDLFPKVSEYDDAISYFSDDLADEEHKLEHFEKQLTDGYKLKDILTTQLKDTDDNLIQMNNLDFDTQIENHKFDLSRNEKKLNSENEYKDELRKLYNQISTETKKYDEDTIEHNYKKYQESKEYLSDVEHKIKLKETQIKQWEKSLEEVEEHEFDEDCEYCVKNSAWHIEKTKSLTVEIKDANNKLEHLLTTKSHREKDIESFGDVEIQRDKYHGMVEDLKQVERDAYKTQAKVKELEGAITSYKNKLEKTIENKTKYEEDKIALKQNYEIRKKLNNVVESIEYSERTKSGCIEAISSIKTTIAVNETKKENLDQEIKQFIAIEQRIQDYDIYLKLVSSDGIPQLIINDALPIIENEVNAVLEHMMAGFDISIVSEDKSINLYIKYGEDKWPLDLSSGMEKFVSSLAIRVGLINVSNLPHPNFLVIDEGFGTLDSDNLSNMKGAFDYLKTRFDSVFIISHLDTIKDFMDYLLPINKNNDYSSVKYM